MKLILIFVAHFTVFSALAVEEVTTNLQRENVNASGSVRIDQYSGNRFSTFDINTNLGYFPWDRIALGLSASIYNDDQNDTVGILGPFAQYFFWQDGRAALSVALGYGHGLTNATVSGRFQSRLSFHYFLTESVAFGPFLDLVRVLGRHSSDYNRVGIGASFGSGTWFVGGAGDFVSCGR